ncbi:MAG: FecR domain-containing protein, partial [Candidatus Eremiobacteraeota bacterium]|nr:FecR domain-containing protein [Candidatus Eremiobacteraeota bacterium]
SSDLAYTGPASAQSYSSGYYGLANISYTSGPTTIVRGDSGAQVAATTNAPIAPGDYVATGPGFAELQFDGSSMLRLANNTQVRLGNMSPGSREIQVANGTVVLAVLSGNSGSAQIDTPSATVRPNQNGDYRVSVLGNGETLVTVRRGSATVSSANGTQTLRPGETFVSNGNSVAMQSPVGFDSFDQFNASRDQNAVTAYNANPYISPQLAGYSNLANYGQWQNVPGYGYAWAPNNQSQSNFAPYQNGQWVWEPGYGYTWVDNSPYGYTTSHYGTWFNNSNYGGWLWQPPSSQYQTSSTSLASAFLPAAVSFFLNGGNGLDLTSLLGMLAAGTSNNYGNADIGWIPLAPGEQYRPWYGQNYSYPTTSYSTVPSVTNIYNYYTNARYYRGVTMVPLSSWRSGRFTTRIVPRPGAIRRIALIRGAVPIVPTTSNLRYRAAAVARPVVLVRTFRAPRLAARAAITSRIAFQTQRARIAAIASAHPRMVTFHSAPAKVTRPIYHPVAHAQIHLAPLAPVRSSVKTAAVHTRAKPAVHAQAKAVVRKESKPVFHAQAKPVVRRQTTPVINVRPKEVPRSEVRTVKPMVPVHHNTAPVQRPVMHPVPTVVHRAPAATIIRTPAPIVHRTVPLERPAMHPAPPVVRSAPRVVPGPRVVPAAKPVPKPEQKPKEHPSPHPVRP